MDGHLKWKENEAQSYQLLPNSDGRPQRGTRVSGHANSERSTLFIDSTISPLELESNRYARRWMAMVVFFSETATERKEDGRSRVASPNGGKVDCKDV
jgi:hypothetical protein